jgi:hypothetical protein
LEEEVEQFAVGLKVAYPVHELSLKLLGLDDPLAAGVPVAAGRAQVAAHGGL